MRRKSRVFLLGFIVLSLGLIVGLALVNFWLRSSVEVGFSTEKGVELRLNNVHYSGTKQGRRVWELEAQSATRYQKDGSTILEGVRMVFYTDRGAPYVLTANRGEYNEGSGLVKVSGHVKVTSEEGYSLKTDTLTYSTGSKEIRTDDPVEIDAPAMNIRGRGLVIKVEEGRFSVLSDVTTVLKDALI